MVKYHSGYKKHTNKKTFNQHEALALFIFINHLHDFPGYTSFLPQQFFRHAVIAINTSPVITLFGIDRHIQFSLILIQKHTLNHIPVITDRVI